MEYLLVILIVFELSVMWLLFVVIFKRKQKNVLLKLSENEELIKELQEREQEQREEIDFKRNVILTIRGECAVLQNELQTKMEYLTKLKNDL